MNFSFFQLSPYVVSVIVFLLIVFFYRLGYRLKKIQIQKNLQGVEEKLETIEGSMLSIMALLLGFTFSVAITKFETRRELVIEDANAIATAILSCDLYPDSTRNHLRVDFKEYVETRINYYRAGNDEDKIDEELKKSKAISQRIWNRIMLVSKNPEIKLGSEQMIPILTNVIEIVTKRDASRISRVPRLILWTLLILVLTSAILLGNDYKGTYRNKVLLIGYALIMTLTLNLILELNNPRKGFITLDSVETKITELRNLF